MDLERSLSPLLSAAAADALDYQVSELLSCKLRKRGRENRFSPGDLPRTIYRVREPPLGHYVPARCTFVDKSPKQLIYVQLISDKAVFEDLIEAVRTNS